MDEEQGRARAFSRWPLLLAATVAISAGIALDVADSAIAPFAAGIEALGAAAFGAFLYAEGARHRDWYAAERRSSDTVAEED